MIRSLLTRALVFKRKIFQKHRMNVVLDRLPKELYEPVILEHHEPDNELFTLFKNTKSAWKWHHYFDVYTKEFESLRCKPIRMLEIGVREGGSLKMWKKWFHPDSLVVGIDIEESCTQHENANNNIFVRIGDQTDNHFLNKVTSEFGPFDLILDDGGHTTSQMTVSFNSLFRNALKAGGIYMVEDTHTNYWSRFIDTKITFIEYCKELVELMHANYIHHQYGDVFRLNGKQTLKSLQVPYIQARLQRISFYDSIVVIEKNYRALPVHEQL